ncbi:MAG: extracellular solute-binding protein [Chloroflexota bacterium]
MAGQLKAEGGQINLFWPASASFKKWQTATLNPAFQKWVKSTYSVDVKVNSLSTGGGDASFFQILTAYEESHPRKPSFSIDVARTAPTLQLFDEIDKGWFLPLEPDYAPLVGNLKDLNAAGRNVFTRNGKLMAAPLYQPTISYFYNAEKVPNPPKTLKDLLAWAKANPKRFTYSDPRSGTGIGSGVLWQIAVMNALGKLNDPNSWGAAWAYLKDLQKYVYPEPADEAQMIELMRRGDVYLMPFWNDWGTQARRDLKISFMKSYFMQEKMPLRNTPFAVPRGAAHPIGGILYANFALSPEMQRSLATTMNQIPASVSPKVWDGLPANVFGFSLKTIQAHTFAGFNSLNNVKAIDAMVKGYGPKVLGK